MRIVHLSTVREYYGGEVCLANLARGMAARGHEVCCVVRPESRLAAVLPRLGIATHELPLVDWYEPVTVARLGAWLRRGRIDLVHTHNPRDWFIAAAAIAGGPIRTVATRHVLFPVAHAVWKRSFLHRLDTLIAVSAAVRRGVEAARLVPADRIVTVPNGVPLSSPQPRCGALRAANGLGPDDLVVGCVARLSPEKGLDDLLRAAACLRPQWPRLRVLVLGDAPASSAHPASLKALAMSLGLGDVVRFCGYQPDAARLCGEFDIQVVSSHAEPCGLVTLEAMSQGVPVVGTASGGTPELIRDGVEGFLVPPADPGRLARRLDCLLESPGLRREMGRRGRRRVEREFGLEMMVERTEAIYLRALARTAS